MTVLSKALEPQTHYGCQQMLTHMLFPGKSFYVTLQKILQLLTKRAKHT